MSEVNKILKHSSQALDTIAIHAKRKRPGKWDFAEWLTKFVSVKKGGKTGKYSFEGYEPYLALCKDLHKYRKIWVLKGTQVGISTLFIGLKLWLPNWRGYDCAYCLPDIVDVKPFMRTRFHDEQLERNELLRGIYQEHESDYYYSCYNHNIYFLGINVIRQLLSKPIDCISLDEVTIMKKEAIEVIGERMDASDFGRQFAFARELYPGGPADQGFQDGKQTVMLFRCPGCRHYQNLEEIFYQSSLSKETIPRCMKHDGERWLVVCEKCGTKINRKRNGRWVARHPDRDTQSYRVPQLILEGMNLDNIMYRWLDSAKKKSARSQRHSSCLAIPDAGDLQRIGRDTLIKLKRDYDMCGVSSWTIGGMDMGDKCYAVWATFEDDVLKTIWWEVFDSDDVEEKCAKRLRSLNTTLFVIDALPLTNVARRLAYEFPEAVYLNYYRGDVLKDDEKEHAGKEFLTVAQDREQALDDYCDLFTPELPKLIFPAKAIEEDGRMVDFEDSTFAKHHIVGSQKDEVEDNRLGKKIFKFKKHVPNHFFHAGNYMATAMALLAKEEGKFIGTMPIFGSFCRE